MIVNSQQIDITNQNDIFKSYLEREVGTIFSSWKKNFYTCLEGKALIYTQNEQSKIVLGHIPLSNISNPQSLDAKIFQFESEEKIYKLKSAKQEEKEKWINLLNNIIKEKEIQDKNINERSPSLVSEDIRINKRKSGLVTEKKSVINEKICTISKRVARVIKKYGYILNPEDEQSDQILDDKGITSLINIKDPKIKTRIHHGFLYKKHKVHDYFQKRWFFIFSSRPLFDKEYIQDDFDLDAKKQKDWIKFDTLYYFKYQNKNEDKDNLGGLEMVNSHKILHFENNEKYYLNLDEGERIYDFYCDNKFDRDEWFEVLKNSRRTAKEYFASKTKKPRNVELLNVYFLKGEKEFLKKMDNEKKSIVGNYEEIMDYDVFEFNQNNLRDLILSTIDGCLSNNPVKKDLLKGYAEFMTKEYLEITKSFWDRLYDKLEHAVILKMSMQLLIFRESLLELNVDDENLYKNGKELIKIYFKKTYQNILSVIESILKNEREVKGIKSETGELQTHGPSDLFEILSRTFDLVKDNKNKCVYKEILLLFKESIKQYLIGIDTVLMNLNIIVENEYLIAVANNSFSMIKLLNDLIDDMKEMDVLSEKEIYEDIQNQKLMYTINRVSQSSISNFVSQFRLELGKEFKNVNYIDLNMELILIKTFDIFGKFKPLMNILIIKKCWNEILKMTLYHYITCLLMTANKKEKPVKELKQKIKNDNGLLKETYEPVVGPNLTKSTLKIMDDIHDFLDVSSYMISSSCLTLRQYIGNSFTISTVKALIKLRSDFSAEEKDDAIAQCKEVLENYNEPNNNDMGGYFQYMDKELKKQEREEKKQEMLLKMTQSQNESTSRHSIMYSRTFINFNNENNNSESEEDEKISEEEEEPIVGMELADFLGTDDDEDFDDKVKEEIKKIDVDVGESLEYKEVSDIEYEGYMSKKSHQKWQRRYFQLKNGYLYWYLDKKSSIIQNKISIKDTEKVESHKDKKFLIRIKEVDEKGKSKCKEYKFMCESEEEKLEWIFAITNSMKKVKNAKILSNQQKIDIKIRKKVIHDLFKLPDINKDKGYMRNKVLEALNNENYFKPSQRKIEADKKKAIKEEEERKKREKLEMERKKREEKEEKERKKREEKEKKLKEEMEKDKQIEQDIKEGKSVGVTNRIKFWFKGLGKGNEEEEIKDNNPINTEQNNDKNEQINNFNLDDFMNGDEEGSQNSEQSEKSKEDKNNKNENNENNDKKENEGINNDNKKNDNINNKETNNVKPNNDKEGELNDKNINKEEIKTKNLDNDKNKDIKDVNNEINNNKDNKKSEINTNITNDNKNNQINENINITELTNEAKDLKKEQTVEKKEVCNKNDQNENTKNKINDTEAKKETDTEEVGSRKDVKNKNMEEEEEEDIVDIKELMKKRKESENEKEKENEKNNNSFSTDHSKLNNGFYDELYSDQEDEDEKKPKEKKEKKGWLSNLFSCGSTNEERNNRRKKKKENKTDQKLIKEEIKQIKKEQNEIKLQKKQMEKEMKHNKETKKKLNQKKFTIIEEKSIEEEEDENKNKDNQKEEEEEEKEDFEKNKKRIEKEKLRILENDNNKEDEKKNNNKKKEEEKEKEKEKIENEEEENEDEKKNNLENTIKEEENKEKDIGVKEKENKKEKKNKFLRKKKRKSVIDLMKSDKISEKSNESDDEEENEKKKKKEKEKEEEEEKEKEEDTIFNHEEENGNKEKEKTKNIKYNDSIEIIDFLKDKEIYNEEKKSFNRYSETGTYNFSNYDYNENNNNEESDSNNIVNFLGNSRKESYLSKNNIDDDEDEKEYLNNTIKKKMIKNNDNVEIVPEKKEEEEESEGQKDNNNKIRKTSIVQIMEVEHILNNYNNSNNSNDNKIYKDYNNISQQLIKKTKRAERIMKAMNNNYNQNKLDEKIAKIKNQFPNIKTKYEIYLEEEKKREDINKDNDNDNDEEKTENQKDLDNNEKVKDWWNGIFN